MRLSAEVTRYQSAAFRAFISYHSADRQTVGRLRVHLAPLSHDCNLAFWDDAEITAGSRWTADVDEAINLGHVFLLCISPDYLSSDYLYDHEWPAIQRRVRAVDGLIIPVILRPCLWFGFIPDRQAVPTSADGRVKPISEWRSRDMGLHKASEQILLSIRAHQSGAVAAPPDPRPRVAPPPRSALPDGSSRFDPDEVEKIVKSLNAQRTASNG